MWPPAPPRPAAHRHRRPRERPGRESGGRSGAGHRGALIPARRTSAVDPSHFSENHAATAAGGVRPWIRDGPRRPVLGRLWQAGAHPSCSARRPHRTFGSVPGPHDDAAAFADVTAAHRRAAARTSRRDALPAFPRPGGAAHDRRRGPRLQQVDGQAQGPGTATTTTSTHRHANTLPAPTAPLRPRHAAGSPGPTEPVNRPRPRGQPPGRAAQLRWPATSGSMAKPALEQHCGYAHDALRPAADTLARLPEIAGVESAVVWPGRPYGLQVTLKDAGSVYWMVSGASGVAPVAGEDERLAPQPMPELGGGKVATGQVDQALLTALAAAETDGQVIRADRYSTRPTPPAVGTSRPHRSAPATRGRPGTHRHTHRAALGRRVPESVVSRVRPRAWRVPGAPPGRGRPRRHTGRSPGAVPRVRRRARCGRAGAVP